ncbi:MAG: hypothetical protein ACOCW6_01840 [Spirochaetota bacterium]
MARRLVIATFLVVLSVATASAQDLLGFGFFTSGLDDGSRSDWSIEITSRNSLIVTHTRGGEMTALGPLTMSPEDGAAMWSLVEAARFDRREGNIRVREFKEVLFTFITVDDVERKSFILWRQDAVRDRRLRRLVQGIEKLIEEYAGSTPEIL